MIFRVIYAHDSHLAVRGHYPNAFHPMMLFTPEAQLKDERKIFSSSDGKPHSGDSYVHVVRDFSKGVK